MNSNQINISELVLDLPQTEAMTNVFNKLETTIFNMCPPDVNDLYDAVATLELNMADVHDAHIVNAIYNEYPRILMVNLFEDSYHVIKIADQCVAINGEEAVSWLRDILNQIEYLDEIVLDFHGVQIQSPGVLHLLMLDFPAVKFIRIKQEILKEAERLEHFRALPKFHDFGEMISWMRMGGIVLNRPYVCIYKTDKFVFVPTEITRKLVQGIRISIKRRSYRDDAVVPIPYTINAITLFTGDAAIFNMEQEEYSTLLDIFIEQGYELPGEMFQVEKDHIEVVRMSQYKTDGKDEAAALVRIINKALETAEDRIILDFTAVDVITVKYLLALYLGVCNEKRVSFTGFTAQQVEMFKAVQHMIRYASRRRK